MVLAAEAGHEADAGQLQAAVRVLAQILVTGAVEGFLGPCGHPLGQVAETHAFEHSVGEEGRAAGLEVVALDAGVVHHLPEHAGLLVLELVDVLDGLLEHRHDAAVLVVELLVHPLQHVHHRHHEPAHGPQPEVGAAAGDGVGPVHLVALIVAVVVQAGLLIPHVLPDVHELLVAVDAALHLVVTGLVLHIEGLGHVGAVQPDLPRINVLVPEVALPGAGLGEQLAADGVDGLAVLLVAEDVVEDEQVFALIHVVEVVLLRVVGLDGAVFLHEPVDEIPGKFQVLLVAGSLIQAQAGGDHAAVDVVPLVGLAAADLLDVPHGCLGAGIGDEVVHIIAQHGQNLFMSHGLVLLKMADVGKAQALALVALDLDVVQLDVLDVLGVDGQLLDQRAVVGHGSLTLLGVGVEGDGDILHGDALDGLLGQAVEVAARKLCVGGHDVFHGQGAELRGVLVHGQSLAALDIGTVAVRVAEVEHIDDEGSLDAPHLHVAEHQTVDDGGVAAAAAGLDAEAAVGVVHEALGDHHVLDAAAHLAADDDAAVAFVQQAVADDGVLAALLELHAEEDLAGLHGDAVVTDVDVHADDAGVLAALGVDAVGVGGVVGVVDVEVQQVEMFDEDGVDGPGVAVLHGDAVEADILAVHHRHGAGTPCDALDLGVDPPVAVLGVAVQCAFAGDDDVMHLGDVQQARKAVQRVALPAGEVVFVHFVLAGDDAGQDGVVGAVVVAQQHSALLEVEGGAALHEEAGGAVAASGDIYRAALGAGGKSSLQPAGIVGLAVGDEAVAGCVHKEALGLGGEIQLQVLTLGVYLHGVGGGRSQGEEGEHVGVAAFVNGLAVQSHGKGVLRAEALAVFQLEDGAAGHGTDERQIHFYSLLSYLRRFAACPQRAGMVHWR